MCDVLKKAFGPKKLNLMQFWYDVQFMHML